MLITYKQARPKKIENDIAGSIKNSADKIAIDNIRDVINEKHGAIILITTKFKLINNVDIKSLLFF